MWLPLSVFATVLWGANNVITDAVSRKTGSPGVELPQLLLFWSLGHCILAVPAILVAGMPPLAWAFVLAGCLHFFQVSAFFSSYGHGDTSTIAPLIALSPLFTWTFCSILLGESLTLSHWAAFVLLVSGGLVIGLKGALHASKGVLFILGSDVLVGLYVTLLRFLVPDRTVISSVQFYGWSRIGGMVAFLVFFLFFRGFRKDVLATGSLGRRLKAMAAIQAFDVLALSASTAAIVLAPSGPIYSAVHSSGIPVWAFLFAIAFGAIRP